MRKRTGLSYRKAKYSLVQSSIVARIAPPKDSGPQICQLSGCKEEAVRSISADKLKKAMSGTSLKEDSRRVHICKTHYRQFRKKTKGDRELERLGW